MSKIIFIAKKDLLVEFRQKGVLNTIFLFSFLVLLVVYFTLNQNAESLHRFGPQALWISLLFSSFLGLNHFMQIEKENDCLSALVSAPVDPWKVYLAKVLSVVVVLSTVEVILVPCFFLFFSYSITGLSFVLLPVLLLGNLGIAAIGTLFSSLLLAGNASEYLLPIVMLPLLLPLLIAGIHATEPLLEGGKILTTTGSPLNRSFNWIIFLLAMNLVFVPTGSILSETIYKS